MVERLRVDATADTGGPYSQAVKSNGLLFISGQVALAKNGDLIGKDIATRTDQVMKNIKIVLTAAGCTFDDVIKISIFLVNLDDRPKFHEVQKKYFTNIPASTLLVVKSLANKDYLVEVEAIAQLST
jgi:2-iminobutanoate/2-iminopropanoate deaminase